MIHRFRFILLYLLLMATWSYIHFHATTTVPVTRPLMEFPGTYREWRMISQSRFSEEILNVLKPTDYLWRQYEGKEGGTIGLYIGYHDGGTESGEIHSPKHCLPGSGWLQVSTTPMLLSEPQCRINLVKAVYQKGDSKELLFYWFQVHEMTLSDEYTLKLAEVMNAIIHGRRDAAFIRVTVPFETDEDQAVQRGIGFIRDIYPLIRGFLPS